MALPAIKPILASAAKTLGKQTAASFAEKLLRQEDKKTGNIILTTILCIMAFLSLLYYTFEMPEESLTHYFGEEMAVVVSDFRQNYSLMGNNFRTLTEHPFSNSDWRDFGALDSESFERLMNVATQFVGWPYVWGGSSPSTSFDCSGFIFWVFNDSGVYPFPRTTAQGIFNMTIPIPREEAVAGDLIFFQNTFPADRTVTHVGIYMGNGYMLHAGDPIGFDSINTPFWTRHFYAFGRLPTRAAYEVSDQGRFPINVLEENNNTNEVV